MKTWEVFKPENFQRKFRRLIYDEVCRFDSVGVLLGGNGFAAEGIQINEDWELVPLEVDFMTAINGKQDIKPYGISSDFRPVNYWLHVHALSLEMVNGKWLIE